MSGLSPSGLIPSGTLPLAGDATAAGVTLNSTASVNAGAASGSSGANAAGANLNATATLTPGAATGGGASGTITITSPSSYQILQRNTSTNLANIAIAGAFTGAPTGIQARFNGGAWQTIVASPSGSSYAGTLNNCPVGQGLLEVKFTNDATVTAQKIKVGVGDIFIVGGQSNNSGRATSAVQPANTNFTACEFLDNNTWGPLQEATTQIGSFDDLTGNPYSIRNGQATAGSWFGAVSSYFDAAGVPVAFVPCAVGSTVISSWQQPTPHNNTTQYYGVMLTRAQLVGDHRALIFWQGESDASGSTTQAAYQTALAAMIDAWYADTGRKTIICKICLSGNSGTVTQIRAGQDYVAANDANVLGIVDMNVWASGNVHYMSTTEINAVASAFWGTMGLTIQPAAGATLTSTATLTPGAATGSANGTAGGATLTSTATLTPGSTSAGSTEPGATLNSTATLTPGAATGGGSGSGTAGGANLNSTATLTPGGVGAGSTEPGATLTSTATISPGAATGSGSGTAPGATLNSTATVNAGMATGGGGDVFTLAILKRTSFVLLIDASLQFIVGDVAVLHAQVVDFNGTPVDPDVMILLVANAAGTVTPYTPSRDAVGNYHVDLPLSAEGSYRFRWVGTGANAGAGEGSFYVFPSVFVN